MIAVIFSPKRKVKRWQKETSKDIEVE
jgi:hypothetical protein